MIYISVQPTDLFFAWQLNIQLHNFRKLGISDKYHVLLYTAPTREVHPLFYALQKEYTETKFVYFDDRKEGKCWHLIKAFNYPPLARPWCLEKYYKDHPELKDEYVFYLDSDVIFTKIPDYSFIEDESICYLSDTRSYIAASYFDSKIKDVLPIRLKEYEKRDILEECAKELGISRDICQRNELNTGGAQYLLKGIDSKFWANVLDGCMILRVHLTNVNNRFFESENKGFQVWCADMWAVLWNLWKRNVETRIPKEMDFCWSTTNIEEWNNPYMIYHDAGADDRCFNKMQYRTNEITPFHHTVNFDKIDKTLCSYKYVQELLESKTIFNNLKL